MSKYIILMPDNQWGNFKYFYSPSAKVLNIYKGNNASIYKKVVRKIVYFFGLGISNIFYSDWTNYLYKDVQFIVFDSSRPYHRLLRKLKKAKNKPIVYFWNPIKKSENIKKLKKYFRVSTYSAYDAKKYQLEYNPTFYIGTLVKCKEEIVYDAIFLGRNKSRLPILEKIYTFFDNPYFYIVKDNIEESKILDLKTISLPYENYLNILVKTKSIVEILYSDNADFSLRTMEALFYQKKLITNNKCIAKADFFNLNNIFILHDDTTKEDIKQFLELPFIPYKEEQINFYTVENWLTRFKSS